MKNVLERAAENKTDEKIRYFKAKQAESYEFKVRYAEIRAWEFYNHPEIDGNCYVAVGGLDSITLLLFLRSIGINVPAISVSSLEDKSIQAVHKALGVQALRPLKSKVEVLREFGWPVLSKEIAGKISMLQHPSEKNATVRHAIITGETGAYGGYRTGTRMKLSQKWLEKFGGYENEAEGVDYQIPDFLVSDKCCYYLKEKPCNDYAKESGRFPYMGLMASEGGRRQKALMINGCNYISPGTKRSCPSATSRPAPYAAGSWSIRTSGTASGSAESAGRRQNMLYSNQISRAAFDLWIAESCEDNRSDIDRMKRMLPFAMKECCTEKQKIYITYYFADRMTTAEIAALCGVNKSTVSRVIHAGLHNLNAHLKFCSPGLCTTMQKQGRLTQAKIGHKKGAI